MSLSALKQRARELKRNIYILYRAAGDPRVPLLPKLVMICVIAYAVSPVDLIPDFIPVLGYLDDLILLPLGIWLAVKLVPESIWEEYRERYKDEHSVKIPASKRAAAVIAAVWVAILLICFVWIKSFFKDL